MAVIYFIFTGKKNVETLPYLGIETGPPQCIMYIPRYVGLVLGEIAATKGLPEDFVNNVSHSSHEFSPFVQCYDSRSAIQRPVHETLTPQTEERIINNVYGLDSNECNRKQIHVKAHTLFYKFSPPVFEWADFRDQNPR